jgi:hypothetical protein
MTRQPPFDTLRAAFLLLAVVVLAELGLTLFAAVGCFWMILTNRLQLGACATVGNTTREIFAELLTAVLALLLAGRSPPPPPPPGGRNDNN